MEIQIFKNDRFGEVRTMVINGEPWFVGKDVASVLGYKDSINALKCHVDAEDKLGWQIATSGQRREMTIINESGLYALILSSKLPQAKEFKRWVTSVILPSIRRNGAYLTDDALTRFAEDPDYGIKLLNTLKRERTERYDVGRTARPRSRDNVGHWHVYNRCQQRFQRRFLNSERPECLPTESDFEHHQQSPEERRPLAGHGTRPQRLGLHHYRLQFPLRQALLGQQNRRHRGR